MLLLTSTLALLLIGHVDAQNLDLSLVNSIPTLNVDSALAVASSATGQLSGCVHNIWIGY